MKNEFKVGDRVMLRPPKWALVEEEVTRYGTVEEIYNGRSTCHGAGETLIAVRWDERDQQRGFLVNGRLEREPIFIPTFQVSDTPPPVVE